MLSPEKKAAVELAAMAARISESRTGLPAEITLSQFIIESAYGAKAPNCNPFGLKAYPGCYGTQELMTWEVENGQRVEKPQTFATFPSLEAAFDKHAELLTTAMPYRKAWKQYQKDKQLEPFIRAVSGVYATDPAYADKLLRILAMPEVKAALASQDRSAT